MGKHRLIGITILAALALAVALTAGPAAAKGGQALGTHQVFARSFVENDDFTAVTMPLHRGTSGGEDVWYVVTDSSDRRYAAQHGVNYSPKLANAAGTTAVMDVAVLDGVVDFPDTVDFSPDRVFPPTDPAQPGAVGQGGYSPLIELEDGTILNASHVAVGEPEDIAEDHAQNLGNKELSTDKATAIDFDAMTVTFFETLGLFDHHAIHYISLDASAALPAVLENVTLAPALNAAPGQGDNSDGSSRAGIIAFTNGQTGADNPERQGLNSVIEDDLVPLNIIQARPLSSGGLYSPLWDVHLTEWQVPVDQRLRQSDFEDVAALADAGTVTGPAMTPWGASGVVANCPAISTSRAIQQP